MWSDKAKPIGNERKHCYLLCCLETTGNLRWGAVVCVLLWCFYVFDTFQLITVQTDVSVTMFLKDGNCNSFLDKRGEQHITWGRKACIMNLQTEVSKLFLFQLSSVGCIWTHHHHHYCFLPMLKSAGIFLLSAPLTWRCSLGKYNDYICTENMFSFPQNFHFEWFDPDRLLHAFNI